MRSAALARRAVALRLDASAQEAALHALHAHGYQPAVAVAQLGPAAPVGPAGASAQLASWAERERALFASAMLSHGKDFFAIRKHVLPHKSVQDLVHFYYARKVREARAARAHAAALRRAPDAARAPPAHLA